MRTVQKISITLVLALLMSCGSTTKFPVSTESPAADITVETKKQGAQNYLLTITAINLAASERLSPPKRFYIIWVVSETGVTRNVGNFNQKNAVKSTYQASFPYKIVEVFITAEDEEGSCWPAGVEITRVRL